MATWMNWFLAAEFVTSRFTNVTVSTLQIYHPSIMIQWCALSPAAEPSWTPCVKWTTEESFGSATFVSNAIR